MFWNFGFTVLPQRQGIDCLDASSRRCQQRHSMVVSFLDDKKKLNLKKGAHTCAKVKQEPAFKHRTVTSHRRWGAGERVHGEKTTCIATSTEKQTCCWDDKMYIKNALKRQTWETEQWRIIITLQLSLLSSRKRQASSQSRRHPLVIQTDVRLVNILPH